MQRLRITYDFLDVHFGVLADLFASNLCHASVKLPIERYANTNDSAITMASCYQYLSVLSCFRTFKDSFAWASMCSLYNLPWNFVSLDPL